MHILTEKRIHFTSICSPEYPRRLKTIPDAPLGLFYRGELPPEQKGIIAIVGARMCSPYGKAMAELIARTTSQCGGIVVSGGAYGIDGVAQMEVVRCQGKSYSVLGCGADKQYPSTNSRLFHELERCGGILSEYPAGTEPRKYHFPMRNRIISGLADAVVVVEAKKQSGSLITADFALSQGREVIAVPGRPDDELSSGCNELIAQGAGIFRSPEQFIEEVLEPAGLQKIEKTTELALAPSEKLVYSSLGLHPKSLEELQRQTGISMSELNELLLRLEFRHLAQEISQNCFIKLK